MRRAFAFLSIFGGASAPTPLTFVWFPFVGAVLGIIVGGAWWASDRLWSLGVAATITVVVDLVLTGLLHFDGLADAGDGLLAPMTRERRLAAMTDPAIGAFGVVSVATILLLRVSALAATRPSIFAIAGLWCASRTSMLGITLILPYAKGDGIVRSFLGGAQRSRAQRRSLQAAVGIGLVAAGALLSGARSFRGAAALGAELVAIAMVALLSWRRVGGYTGDVLGASGVIGETLGLLVLAIR